MAGVFKYNGLLGQSVVALVRIETPLAGGLAEVVSALQAGLL
jgi:hypothetical protein